MRPENVKPSDFKVKEIIYNNGNFAIAYGNFRQDAIPCLAVRWNLDENNPNDLGYPNNGKEPKWLVIDNDLKIPFLKSILGNPNAKNDKVLDIILGKL